MQGYKIFNPDMTCRGMKYEIGQEYKMNDDPILCKRGFHFCVNPIDLFTYYRFDPENVVCRVEALGDCVAEEDDSKHVTNHIRIGERVSWADVLKLVNAGNDNTGLKNSGNRNSGDWNSGSGNSGDRNTGYENYGDWNSGDWNYGDRNSGNENSGGGNSGNGNSGKWNSGNLNSGYENSGNGNSGNRNSGNANSGYGNSGNWNSGNWNSGNWNAGNHHAGFFCTGEAKMSLFNRPTDLTYYEVTNLLKHINIYPCQWVLENAMSDTEMAEHPEYKTTGGYIKTRTLHEVWQEWWANASINDKEIITTLPNFDPDIFLEITGIDVRCVR